MKQARATAASNENSILLNLKELMHLESERAHEEAARVAEAAEVAERVKAEAAAAVLREAEAQRVLEEQAREEARVRDAAAEAQAARDKEASELRVRLEFEHKTRAMELEKRLEHERALLADARLSAPRGHRFAVLATVGVVFATAGALVYLAQQDALPALPTIAQPAAIAPQLAAPAPAPVEGAVAAPPPALTETRATPRVRTPRTRVRAPREAVRPSGLDSLGEEGPADVLVGIEETRSPRRRR